MGPPKGKQQYQHEKMVAQTSNGNNSVIHGVQAELASGQEVWRALRVIPHAEAQYKLGI